MEEYRNDVMQTMIALDKGFSAVVYMGRDPKFEHYSKFWDILIPIVRDKYCNTILIHGTYSIIVFQDTVRYVALCWYNNPPFGDIAIVLLDEYDCPPKSIWLKEMDRMFDTMQ